MPLERGDREKERRINYMSGSDHSFCSRLSSGYYPVPVSLLSFASTRRRPRTRSLPSLATAGPNTAPARLLLYSYVLRMYCARCQSRKHLLNKQVNVSSQNCRSYWPCAGYWHSGSPLRPACRLVLSCTHQSQHNRSRQGRTRRRTTDMLTHL